MTWALAPLGLLALVSGLALLTRALRPSGRPAASLGPGAPLLLAAAAGAAGSVLVQSSSLCAAGLVAAADAGNVGLAEAWAAITGANVGTTLLPQLVAWEPPWFVLAGAAAVAAGAWAHPRFRRPGSVALGAVVLLIGFRCLSAGLGPGAWPVEVWLGRAAAGPGVVPFVAGVGLTAALFSSHLTIAVAQGMAAAGTLAPAAGIAFVCGANIGTTADVLVASVGAGRWGRLTALFHLAFNVLLAGMGLAAAGPAAAAFAYAGVTPARVLAHAHTGLNLVTAGMVLPWIRPLAHAARSRAG